MKIVLTGSHFTPAQAVIEEFRENYQGVEIVYIGRRYTREGDKTPSAESEIIPSLGVKFIPITTGRLQRSFTRYTIPSLFKIPIGFLQAFYYLLRVRPDVVLSLGGYVAVPVVFSAWLLSIPVIIHEQTLVTGLANTITSWFADKIAVSFNREYNFKKEKVYLTGNPLRKELLQAPVKLAAEVSDLFQVAKKEKLPIILVTGGNQGSHIINQAVEKALGELNSKYCVIHQTGDSKFGDYERLEQNRAGLKYPQRYLVKKWLTASELAAIYPGIDLAVSRAGANTLLELAYFGVPALAVPLPYLHRNEQNVNAKFFANLGLAKVLPQSELDGKSLLGNIDGMVSQIGKLKVEAKRAKSVVIEDASKRLVLETVLLHKSTRLRRDLIFSPPSADRK